VNGEKVAEGRIEHTNGYAISSDDAADGPASSGAPCSPSRSPASPR
jgi:hypothetical protein